MLDCSCSAIFQQKKSHYVFLNDLLFQLVKTMKFVLILNVSHAGFEFFTCLLHIRQNSPQVSIIRVTIGKLGFFKITFII